MGTPVADRLAPLIERAAGRTTGPWGRLREERVGITLHYDGSVNDVGAISWLLNPQCKVSYNFLVFDDGRVAQVTPENARAFHAGVCRPSGRTPAYTDANSAFYGIALATTAGVPATNAQIRAVRALCDRLCAKHGWKLSEVLTTHAHEAWPRGRKVDTGSVLSIEQVLRLS